MRISLTASGRVSLSDVNKRLWFLANPMARQNDMVNCLRNTPLFVLEAESDKAFLVGANLQPLTSVPLPIEQLKEQYCVNDNDSMDYAIHPDLVQQLKLSSRLLGSTKKGVSEIAAGQIFTAATHAGIAMRLDGWVDCARFLNRQRYSVQTWFERDRSNITLLDELTQQEVVNLWDEGVNDALESGYLCSPRGPRPSERDWLEPVMNYAQQIGAIGPPIELSSTVKPPVLRAAVMLAAESPAM